MKTSQFTLGSSFVLGACFCYQIGAVFAVYLFDQVSPWTALTLRVAVAAIFLGFLGLPRFLQWTRQQWLAGLALGVSLVVMNGCYYRAIAELPLGVAVSFEFLGPLAIALLTSRKTRDFLWILVTALGVALLGYESYRDSVNLPLSGVIFALLAACGWACYILATDRMGKVFSKNEGLSGGMALATIFSLPFGWQGLGSVLGESKLLVFALGMGLFGSVFTYLLEINALRMIPKNVFSVLFSLEPVVGGILGFVFLNQHLSLLNWLAMILLIIASVGISLSHRRPQDIVLADALP